MRINVSCHMFLAPTSHIIFAQVSLFWHIFQAVPGASSRSTSSSIAAEDELPRPLKQPSGRFMNPWKKNGSSVQLFG